MSHSSIHSKFILSLRLWCVLVITVVTFFQPVSFARAQTQRTTTGPLVMRGYAFPSHLPLETTTGALVMRGYGMPILPLETTTAALVMRGYGMPHLPLETTTAPLFMRGYGGSSSAPATQEMSQTSQPAGDTGGLRVGAPAGGGIPVREAPGRIVVSGPGGAVAPSGPQTGARDLSDIAPAAGPPQTAVLTPGGDNTITLDLRAELRAVHPDVRNVRFDCSVCEGDRCPGGLLVGLGSRTVAIAGRSDLDSVFAVPVQTWSDPERAGSWACVMRFLTASSGSDMPSFADTRDPFRARAGSTLVERLSGKLER